MTEALIAVTYRCNARCHMCNTWQHPSAPGEEVTVDDLRSLPAMRFANITGGEPFLRADIEELVGVIRSKARRVVISTNGYFTEKVVNLAKRFPGIGVRVSLEGLPAANDELRGIEGGFDHGLRTLLRLRALGMRDIGFGITLSDRNADDLLELYELANAMGVEFATAAVHNSYYFHKVDNVIAEPERVAARLEELSGRMLASRRPKDWFRAWFNMGLANYVRGGDRLLPCRVATDVFFVDPFGYVQPCNGMEMPLGSLKERAFETIWNSERAQEVRRRVATCDKRCWMIGSVAPAMKRDIGRPARWILKAKLTRTLPAVKG